MRYVVDASVGFKWVVTESHSDKAQRLRADFHNAVHELLAPDLFPIEIAHALTRAERQGRIAVLESGRLLTEIFMNSPALHPSLPLLPRACEISSRMRIGIYDCLYVALAEREGCELVTADTRLVQSLRPRYTFLMELSALP